MDDIQSGVPTGQEPVANSTSIFNAPPKTMFALGIMVGISAVSILGFLLSFNAYRNATSGTSDTKKIAGAAVNSNTNTAVVPTDAAADVPRTNVDVKVASTDNIIGKKNAKVTLVEFSDFQCPYCEKFKPTIDQVLKDYKDQVRVVFKHYPLTTIHPQAQKAAEAAECAAEQGKFWEMHDKLFANQSTLSVDNFKVWAKDLKLNSSKFNDCLDNSKMAAKVSADQQQATTVGVSGTPTSFINGTEVSGAQSYDFVKGLIDQALAKT